MRTKCLTSFGSEDGASVDIQRSATIRKWTESRRNLFYSQLQCIHYIHVQFNARSFCLGLIHSWKGLFSLV